MAGWGQAALRPLTGADEALLVDEDHLLPAERATALLGRCLPGGAEAARGLTVGERERLLLELRRLTFGDRLQCVVDCPECGERLDLDLRLSDLLVEGAPAGATHEATLDGRSVRFRLPNGADQEAAARVAPDLDAAARLVLERCVDGEPPDGAAAGELAELMAELDPQAETRLRCECPECGAPFTALLDACDLLFRELRVERDGLYRDVHALASHYGWSEAEIVALSRRRRRLYLDLIADSVGAGA